MSKLYTMYNLHCTLHNVQCTLYNEQLLNRVLMYNYENVTIAVAISLFPVSFVVWFLS